MAENTNSDKIRVKLVGSPISTNRRVRETVKGLGLGKVGSVRELKRSAAVDLPAGSLPTNVCIGGTGLDELYVTAAHSQSLLRIRFDARDPSPA